MSLLKMCSSSSIVNGGTALPNVKTRKKTAQTNKLGNKDYARELRKLHTRLVGMQEWVRASGAKLVIVFEGRDAPGKGGLIPPLMDRLSPPVFPPFALPTPTHL